MKKLDLYEILGNQDAEIFCFTTQTIFVSDQFLVVISIIGKLLTRSYKFVEPSEIDIPYNPIGDESLYFI